MTVTVGASPPLSWAPGGNGAVTLAVLLPDGTTLSPAPTVAAAASPYSATFLTTQAGRHLLTWSRGTERFVDVLDVWPVDPHYLISVADGLEAVKAGASAPASVAADLPLYIAAASLVIEDLCGPLVPATLTHKARGGRPVLLPHTNITVDSVTVDGVALPASAYEVDEVAGIVYTATVGLAYAATGTRILNVTVTYKVGVALLPANLRLACMEQLRFLWQTTRQGTGRAAQELGYTPSGYAVPYMVQGLCASHPPAPGFA